MSSQLALGFRHFVIPDPDLGSKPSIFLMFFIKKKDLDPGLRWDDAYKILLFNKTTNKILFYCIIFHNDINPSILKRYNNTCKTNHSLRKIIFMENDQKPIVIAADSDPAVHDAIREALQNDYTLLHANNGLEVFTLVKNNPSVIAIIMDPTMANLDGITTTKMLKADFTTYHIPIIMLTEQIDFEDIIEAVECGADDYMHKPFKPKELQARIVMNIRQAERDQNANPLTRLPGNEMINRVVRQRMNKPLAVLYLDLDNFKAYNDKYGFNKGDLVLLHTASVLAQGVRAMGNADDFVGHIGGDDYVIVSTPNRAEGISQHICKHFDESIVQFYTKEDQDQKKIVSVNRKGQVEEFPLISISIAIVMNDKKELTSMPQIAQLAAELKKYAKSKPAGELGSSYVIDRRKN